MESYTGSYPECLRQVLAQRVLKYAEVYDSHINETIFPKFDNNIKNRMI